MSKPYPYRFKTETEFIDEFGTYWSDHIETGWNVHMNKFFGKSYLHNIKYDSYLPSYKGWGISWDMLIKNVPNYKSRRRKNEK